MNIIYIYIYVYIQILNQIITCKAEVLNNITLLFVGKTVGRSIGDDEGLLVGCDEGQVGINVGKIVGRDDVFLVGSWVG